MRLPESFGHLAVAHPFAVYENARRERIGFAGQDDAEGGHILGHFAPEEAVRRCAQRKRRYVNREHHSLSIDVSLCWDKPGSATKLSQLVPHRSNP